MFLGEHITRALQFGLDLFRREARGPRRTVGRIQPEIDDGEAAAGFQRVLQPAEIIFTPIDVVVDVDIDDQVGLFRQTGIAWFAEQGGDVFQAFAFRARGGSIPKDATGKDCDRRHVQLQWFGGVKPRRAARLTGFVGCCTVSLRQRMSRCLNCGSIGSRGGAGLQASASAMLWQNIRIRATPPTIMRRACNSNVP